MKWEAIRQACRQVPVIVWGYRSLRLMAGALILLCLQAVRPLVKIRVGLLHYDRIGHLASNTEYWLRKEYPNKLPGEKFLLLSTPKPANHQLLLMFARVIPVIMSSGLYSIMYAAYKQWPGLSVWLDLRSTGAHDYDLWSNSKPQLAFTDEEMLRGTELLRTMGIPAGAPFVCFAMRDKTYLETHTSGASWRYHDYRDVNVENCRLMAEWLAARGIWVIRMGAAVGKPFHSGNPRIIDYACNFRSDFGDIFLLGNCKFFVGDTAGIFWPAAILGVPVLLTNLVPINYLIPLSGSMLMLKKYRRQPEGGLISCRNVIGAGIDDYMHTHEYEESGIELVENTPEEILGAAREMNARIDGTWVSTPADEELHARFWSIFPEGHPSHGCPARVPIDFLRRNPELIA